MKELWRDVEGYEGLYLVSNLGRVKNNKGVELLGYKEGEYQIVSLRNKGFKIHRLVSKAFLPNPEDKLYIRHKNKNKLDNKVENLEWFGEKKAKKPLSLGDLRVRAYSRSAQMLLPVFCFLLIPL